MRHVNQYFQEYHYLPSMFVLLSVTGGDIHIEGMDTGWSGVSSEDTGFMLCNSCKAWGELAALPRMGCK